ncbi:MAG: SDR family NAD(P)-dependent oxidoreductase [Corynebacterium sp.]|nr:SDR family NAD(P)-dependent oxidoreductase [Corynebacterium sp.]
MVHHCSSRGLDRSFTVKALEAGHQVAATARKPEQLADLVAQYGDQILPLQLDVTDYEAAQRAIAATVEKFGRVDVVVNNAGYANTASVKDMPMEMFRSQFETVFFGVVNVTKAVLPIMRQQQSEHIIQISSLGGRIAGPGLTAYQSAKWAVGGFSEGVAQEVAHFGIKVIILEPGGMRTDWAGSSMKIPEISEPYRPTVGALAELMHNASGSEPTDPNKVAELLLKLVELSNPPVRLLVGTDAVQYAEAAENARRESDIQWRELSTSVGFDEA